jgi:leucyl aminopeptidase
MKITVTTNATGRQKTDGLVIPVFEKDKALHAGNGLDQLLGGMISRLITQGDFSPAPGRVHIVYPEGRIAAARVALAGMGNRSDLTLNRLRQATGAAAPALREAGAGDVALFLDGLGLDPENAAEAATEGALLGLYRYLTYKTPNEKTKKDIRSLVLLTEQGKSANAMRRGAASGQAIADGAELARDLVSAPPADMTPAALAARARQIGREFSVAVNVLERRQMEKLGMGALLGVGAGSSHPPKFIILEYRRGGDRPVIALVGKSITFDSGGISIKPSEGMDRMKDDMAGGAAVLGALRAAAALRLPLNIVGLLPAAENMPGGSAYRPGDVLRTMAGKTIEIISTDAEGRLILSDALAYACRYKPGVIVDIATLTGACRIALGQEASGMLGTGERFKQMISEAGEKTGERVWELPLWEGYYENIKSDIADMKNAGGRDGGVITAAALLSKFVEKYPWVHLDIAATAWTEKDRPYTPKGASGVGTRLLIQFLRDCAAKARW